jgi:hypothetical protein
MPWNPSSSEVAANAQTNAANNQLTAADKANAQQQANWEQTQANQKPWLTAGTDAVNKLSTGTAAGGQFSTVPTFDPNSVNLQQDPGYQFRLQQGVNALTAAGSAAGNLGSGNMGTALVNYGQQAGSQEYGAAYQRAMDQYNSGLNAQNTMFNRLSGIAGTGQVATNQLASYGAQNATAQGNNSMNAANLAGQYQTNAANGLYNAGQTQGNQLMGIGGQLANYFTNQNALQNQQYNAQTPYSGASDSYGVMASDANSGWTAPSW